MKQANDQKREIDKKINKIKLVSARKMKRYFVGQGVRLQNSPIFCKRERRRRYWTERSGASVEKLARFTRKDHACCALRLPNREGKTTAMSVGPTTFPPIASSDYRWNC